METSGPGDGLLALPPGLPEEHVLHPPGHLGAFDQVGDPQGSGPLMGATEGEAAGMKERLRSVAVLGAGGKMGSGIAWVALKAMAELDAKENGVPGSGRFALVLIDAEPAAFPRLRAYL